MVSANVWAGSIMIWPSTTDTDLGWAFAAVAPTVPGRLASYYYLSHYTIRMFKEELTAETSVLDALLVSFSLLSSLSPPIVLYLFLSLGPVALRGAGHATSIVSAVEHYILNASLPTAGPNASGRV